MVLCSTVLALNSAIFVILEEKWLFLGFIISKCTFWDKILRLKISAFDLNFAPTSRFLIENHNFLSKITVFDKKYTFQTTRLLQLVKTIKTIEFQLTVSEYFSPKLDFLAISDPKISFLEFKNFKIFMEHQLMSHYDIIWLVDYELRSTGLTSDSVRSDNYSEAWNCES